MPSCIAAWLMLTAALQTLIKCVSKTVSNLYLAIIISSYNKYTSRNSKNYISPARLPIPPPGHYPYPVVNIPDRRKQKIPSARRMVSFRAEDETRTRDPDLGKVVLYQLSYFRLLLK